MTFFHAVSIDAARDLPAWHRGWPKTYSVGALVLDADEPWRVRGLVRTPVLVPEASDRVPQRRDAAAQGHPSRA